MQSDSGYKLVQLASGVHSVHSLAHGETFHPVIGPVAEAEALYIKQINLVNRLKAHEGEFVIWDVGLGAAANSLTVLRATHEIPCTIRLVSFDNTIEPLRFALEHADSLKFVSGYEEQVRELLDKGHASFQAGSQKVNWNLHLSDFPSLIADAKASELPKPHAIMFDAFSPAKNPEMWNQPLFSRLYELLDPKRPCALPTYSRSTMLRVTLLLAGFFVGVGHATGEKDETTIAANHLELIEEPLDAPWLERVRRSTSAEPLRGSVYRQAPLSSNSWKSLHAHPQFQSRVPS